MIVKAEGARLYDREGRDYIDGLASHNTSVVGHGRREIIDAVADRLLVYRIDTPTEGAIAMAKIIVKTAEETDRAVHCLRTLSPFYHKHAVEVNRLENEADRLLRDQLAALFEGTKDAIEVIKWKELYETMEAVTDRCEDVVNVIEGIVLKNSDPAFLLDCLESVRGGRNWIDPELAARVRQLSARVGRRASLAPRERQLIGFVRKGMRNREIAEELGVTEGTVKAYLHAIFEKLGIGNRTELAIRADEFLAS